MCGCVFGSTVMVLFSNIIFETIPSETQTEVSRWKTRMEKKTKKIQFDFYDFRFGFDFGFGSSRSQETSSLERRLVDDESKQLQFERIHPSHTWMYSLGGRSQSEVRNPVSTMILG